jgi:glycosyltransferase involved in cell wall biosynthesis
MKQQNPAIDISVVVIGRNEGARLQACLASVHAAEWLGLRRELIYVDSHSQDGSPALAKRMGAAVYGLGQAKPCAAAGRNIGWRAAQGQLVLFLDGDTLLEPRFLAQALPVMADPCVAAVWGHRREMNPCQSIYTRVLDLDWIFDAGRVPYFGGDALVRRDALAAVDGFDDELVAGEEPELSRRLRELGWQIEHLDTPMTRHDLAITTLRAWWRRAERAGLAYAQVAARYRRTADPLWSAEVQRNRRHAAALLAWPLVFGLSLAWLPWLACAWLLFSVFLLRRSAQRCRWKCPHNAALAWCYALHSHLQQIPILFGQLHWWRLQRARQAPSLIEYKQVQ